MKKKLCFLCLFFLLLCSVSCRIINDNFETSVRSDDFYDEEKIDINDNAKKIGIVMPSQYLERWNSDGDYLRQNLMSKGYRVFLEYSENIIDKQVNDIIGLIEEGVDLLIIAPIDSNVLMRPLNLAKEKNIPVISYDRLIKGTDGVSFYVSFDNYKIGQTQAEFVVKTLNLEKDNENKKYNIEFFMGPTDDNNSKVLYDGAMSIFRPYIDKGILNTPSSLVSLEDTAVSEWNTATAMIKMQNIIDEFYKDGQNKLDIAFCSNDSIALGISKAINTDYEGGNEIIITGQDGDYENLKNIIDGKQTMTVYKHLKNEARVAVDLADVILKGNEVSFETIINAGWDFDCVYDKIEYNNGVKNVPSYLLGTTVIVKENLQKELIDTGYFKLIDNYPVLQ